MAKKKAAKKKTATKKRTAKKTGVKKKATRKKTKEAGTKSSGKPGLYANIHKAQQRAKHGGRPVRKKGEAGAPTAAAFKKSKKTAKKT